MTDCFATRLPHRGVLQIEGEDHRDFLQGLISNDVSKVQTDSSLWAAFLTPQGKFLHEFFVVAWQGGLLLEAEAERLEDLRKRLSRYRLRAKVTLTPATADWWVAAAWGAELGPRLGLSARPGATVDCFGGRAFRDPRDPAVGARLLLPAASAEATLAENFQPAALCDYDLERIPRGLPDGSRDMEVEKAILLENGFDELAGADWQKGCYVGQELTARTKYRALIKKRLLPVAFKDGQDAPGDAEAVMQGEREVGRLRSRAGDRALALLRLEALERPEPLLAAGREIAVQPPHWFSLASAKKMG